LPPVLLYDTFLRLWGVVAEVWQLNSAIHHMFVFYLCY
jgi:hypothetical protein